MQSAEDIARDLASYRAYVQRALERAEGTSPPNDRLGMLVLREGTHIADSMWRMLSDIQASQQAVELEALKQQLESLEARWRGERPEADHE